MSAPDEPKRAAPRTLAELSVPGRSAITLPALDVPASELPAGLVRTDNGLPELSQLDVARHYRELAARNYGVETGFYPLGSCTMKYNPKLAEVLARLPGFADSHPLQDPSTVQGNLALVHALQQWLAAIGGFDAVSLQPAAGAHGELSALLMIRAYHRDRGDAGRMNVLLPDSAHGTNPASATMAGFTAIELPSDARGNVDLEALEAMCDERVAALMLTNPNTLGLFDEHLAEVVACVHRCGGLVYGDGANMNALTGKARPGDLGIDLMHYNLHKTFGTPHGGGGPGSGPIGAKGALADYLPGPVVVGLGAHEGVPHAFAAPARSIGRVSAHFGNFGLLVRAWAYIRLHGAEGLARNAEHAVLNANYLRVLVGEHLHVPFDRVCMHEFVCEGRVADTGVRAIDISKRLMDFGFHPPTNYFPLVVREALMIEPTETESKRTLDDFADAIAAIVREAREDPARLHGAPHQAPVGRVDEVRAARQLRVSDRDTPPAPDPADAGARAADRGRDAQLPAGGDR